MRLITSCLLLAAALPAMAQIYQYTDANGKIGRASCRERV